MQSIHELCFELQYEQARAAWSARTYWPAKTDLWCYTLMISATWTARSPERLPARIVELRRPSSPPRWPQPTPPFLTSIFICIMGASWYLKSTILDLQKLFSSYDLAWIGWLIFLFSVLWAAGLMFTAVFFVCNSSSRISASLLIINVIGNHVLRSWDWLHKPNRLLQQDE